MRTLLVGVGNPGRRDDGLGPALVERLAGMRPPERAVVDITASLAAPSSARPVEAFWTYQLNIEDAATVGDYDRVIFADAALDLAAPAGLAPLEPAASISFTTHEMSPASVLALTEELYGKAPAGFLLKIRGTEWDFAEGLSAEGEQSLAEAERILGEFLKND